MTTKMYGFRATHPGEVLKEEIEYRRISQKELAAQMGMSYNILNDILNGRRSITESTAMLFEAALDIPADTAAQIQYAENTERQVIHVSPRQHKASCRGALTEQIYYQPL